MTKTVSDKRKSPRFDCAVPVEGKKGTAFDSCRTVDLSKGGAGLIVKKPIALDTKMAVELELTPDGEPIVAIGKVTWIQQLPSTQLYRIGLSFTESDSNLNSKINQLFK